MQTKLVVRQFFFKLLHFEFWPWWAMFLPVLPMYFYAVLRTRRLLYFTAVNPHIEMGGFFGEHKNRIMKMIPEKNKPTEIFIRKKDNVNDVLPLPFPYPCFVKPNVGERGFEVRQITNDGELRNYAQKGFDFLIQEKLNEHMELGVLYTKTGETEGKVTSITIKEFMTVRGDGHSPLRELIKQHPRHFIYFKSVAKTYPQRMDAVLRKDEEKIVHLIGNHCKGTRFINGNEYINKDISLQFQNLVNQMEGFDYGRFDLKTESMDHLARGEFKIFELNGISSEPGHIYGYNNVFKAYRDLYKHWNYIFKISKRNIKKGVKTTPLPLFVKRVYFHFFT